MAALLRGRHCLRRMWSTTTRRADRQQPGAGGLTGRGTGQRAEGPQVGLLGQVVGVAGLVEIGDGAPHIALGSLDELGALEIFTVATSLEIV